MQSRGHYYCHEPGWDAGTCAQQCICSACEPTAGRNQKCYNCLAKCNPVEVPYCITKALISAVQGDLDHGLIFVGANVDRIDRMTSVQELMAELTN